MGVLAVGIPVLALLYISTLHRRRQIGLLTAMGWTRADLFVTFLLQAFLLGAAGVLVGGVIAVSVVQYLVAHPIFNWQGFVVRPVLAATDLARTAGAILVTAVVAGTYPAWRRRGSTRRASCGASNDRDTGLGRREPGATLWRPHGRRPRVAVDRRGREREPDGRERLRQDDASPHARHAGPTRRGAGLDRGARIPRNSRTRPDQIFGAPASASCSNRATCCRRSPLERTWRFPLGAPPAVAASRWSVPMCSWLALG